MSGRRDPFKEIEELFEQLNSGFDDLSGEFEEVGAGGGGIHLDIADGDDELVVVADVPGYEPEEIAVSVSDRQLQISAESGTETEEEDTHYYRRERTRRSVSRTVTLPTDVDEREASASYENGVLTIELPKTGGEGGIDIEVN